MGTLKLTDLISMISRRVDDYGINTADACEWLNAGQNRMAIEVGAKFPQLSPTNTNSTFIFDDKWAEIPVLYACVMYKAMDMSFQDEDRFNQQYQDMLKSFIMWYDLPEYLRDDDQSQQFVPTAGQTNFLVTKPTYDSSTGDLKVYLRIGNSPDASLLVEGVDWYSNPDITQDDFTLTLNASSNRYPQGYVVQPTDTVTAVWEIHSDLADPPYSWMGSW